MLTKTSNFTNTSIYLVIQLIKFQIEIPSQITKLFFTAFQFLISLLDFTYLTRRSHCGASCYKVYPHATRVI